MKNQKVTLCLYFWMYNVRNQGLQNTHFWMATERKRSLLLETEKWKERRILFSWKTKHVVFYISFYINFIKKIQIIAIISVYEWVNLIV